MYPLSPAQRRLWFLERLHDMGASFNISLSVTFDRSVDVEALRTALLDVIARHDSLRTVFRVTGGVPGQEVLEADQAVPKLSLVEVGRDALRAAVRDTVAEPFDLEAGPPLRVALFRADDETVHLLLVVHHIIADGRSFDVLVTDLAEAYRARAGHGGPPGWEELPAQYVDYVLWHDELLGAAEDGDSLIARQLAHWREALAGAPEETVLPFDRPRPAVAGSSGAAVTVRWDAQRHGRIATLARSAGCTPFMVIHAALAVLLSRLGTGTDVIVGTVVDGRTEPEIEHTVGLFVNNLVLRTDLSGDPTFVALLARIRTTDLDAYAHQDVPFDRLVQEINPQRSLAHHPLFQVMLAFETATAGGPDFAGPSVQITRPDVPGAKLDLTWQLTAHLDADGAPAGVDGYLEYATELFDGNTAGALVERLDRVLDQALAAPDRPIRQIDVLLPAERRAVLHDWNDTARPAPATVLHREVSRRARERGDAPALIHDGGTVGYRELDLRAGHLAARLARQAPLPGAVVAVALPRSPALVIALLAVLRAGAAYLPIDPDNPPDRINYLLEDAAPSCVVTDAATAAGLPSLPGTTVVTVDDEIPVRPVAGDGNLAEPAVDPDAPAYVLYTSGSTGRPKGAVVSHAAIDNRLRWMQDDYPITTADRVLQKTSAGFDVSVWEFFWPLRTGATLVLAEPGAHYDPARLVRIIRDNRVTVVHFVPTMLAAFLAEPEAATCVTLRRVFSSGEALSRELVRTFHRTLPAAALENLYGPTEAAVDVTAHHCRPAATGPVPIGRPVRNTRTLVLDDRLCPCPVGVAGELYLSGVQLAHGYLRRPSLTASRFVADPNATTPGTRMYRTGDLVRWRPDGELDYLGRNDRQVKIRGQRIELAEIESILAAEPEVGDAWAVMRRSGTGDPVLHAYVTAASGERPDPASLRALLADRLPAAAVPATVTVLDAFPVGPTGKRDASSLPQPETLAGSRRDPRTPWEAELATLFAEELGVARVGPHDDFFALGGHSLLAVRLMQRIQRTTGVRADVRTLFQSRTPAALAAHLRGAPDDVDAYDMLLPIRPGDGSPIIFVHPGTGLGWCYHRVLAELPPDRPVYALQARGLRVDAAGAAAGSLPGTTREMAGEYLGRLLALPPGGPFDLVGWSFGGHVAFEIACQLRDRGIEISSLTLVDSYPEPASSGGPDAADPGHLLATAVQNLLGGRAVPVGGNDPDTLAPSLIEDIRRSFPPLAGADTARVRAAVRVGMNNVRLLATYRAGVYDGDLAVLVAGRDPRPQDLSADAWRPHVTGRVDTVVIEAEHHTMFSTDAARTAAALAGVIPGAYRREPR